MRSIKLRLVMNFMIIIIITVVILELLLITNIKRNHYKNLEENLYNQLKVSTELYYKYFSHTTLQENVLNNVDTFWKQTSAQVQIIDINGDVLMDSIGVSPTNLLHMDDVQKSLLGEYGKWIGLVSYDDHRVMALSYPLKSKDTIVGTLRFITSLNVVDQDITAMAKIYVFLGIIVILISSLVSILLSNTIVGPLQEVTKVAEKMAMGNFHLESSKYRDDEIGKLSDTLNYMAREILKKDQLKNDFVTSVSHELRTPLTSIKGWAITLKNGFDDREMIKDGLDIIEQESDRLSNMVEELLDFSKLLSGKIQLNNEPTDLKELIKQIENEFKPRVKQENISLIINEGQPLPLIWIDKNKLKQVLINVIDNAVKFTHPGGEVKLSISLKGKNLSFKIQDNGIGIPPEDLPKVKEKFYKGRSSRSTNGIGLSISDEIIRAMEGKIDITSGIEQGTMVTIDIPVKEVD